MPAKHLVLIVDDDESLREMYSARFTADGFGVCSAGDGAEALEVVKKEKPDAIVLDIMMPKLDGFAVLKELRAQKPFAKIPIILSSNLGQAEDIAKAKSLGADDYFVKADQSPAELVKKVSTFLKS